MSSSSSNKEVEERVHIAPDLPNGKHHHHHRASRFTSFSLPLVPFPDSFLAENPQLNFQVFLLIQPFINICYYLQLIPFRISKSATGEQLYILKTNIVQQVVSTSLLVLLSIYSLLELRYYFHLNFRERPQDTFEYATYMIVQFLPLCWLVIFWKGKSKFAKLVAICQGGGHGDENVVSQRPTTKQLLASRACLAVMFIKYVIIVYVHYGAIPLQNTLSKFTGKMLYNLHLRNESGVMSVEEREELASSSVWWWALLGTSAAALSIYEQLLILLFDLLSLTASIVAYACCVHHVGRMEKVGRRLMRLGGYDGNCSNPEMDDSSTTTTSSLVSAYLDLDSMMDLINDIFGLPVLVFYMYTYPFFVWSLFERLNWSTSFVNILNFLDMANIFFVSITAAEGAAKVEQFQRCLFQASMIPFQSKAAASKSEGATTTADGNGTTTPNKVGKMGHLCLTTLHQEVSTKSVGLQGGQFFTVTYGFIKTMIGIFITYSIVMIQFVHGTKSN